MMAARIYSMRDLIILLNACNQRSVGLRVNHSRITPKKIMLGHVNPVPFQEGVGEPFKYHMIGLSGDVPRISEFLGVPLLDLNKRFERREEIFELVVQHRFFQISKMLTRFGDLLLKPTESPEELRILGEFVTWWINTIDLQTFIMDSPRPFAYEEVTTEALAFFGMSENTYNLWLSRCADWNALMTILPQVPQQQEPVQVPQQQEPVQVPQQQEPVQVPQQQEPIQVPQQQEPIQVPQQQVPIQVPQQQEPIQVLQQEERDKGATSSTGTIPRYGSLKKLNRMYM